MFALLANQLLPLHHVARNINRSIAITSQDHSFPGLSGFNEIRAFRHLAWLLEFSNPWINPNTSFISPTSYLD